MAGYLRQRKIHKVVFDDTQGDLAGLEVRLYSLTVGQMLDLAKLADQVGDRDKVDEAERLFDEFTAALVGWNLEEETPDADGVGRQPVPPTADGVRSCDLDFVLRIIRAWMDAIASVPGPLGPGSPPGPPSGGLQIPMEPLSPSPPSL